MRAAAILAAVVASLASLSTAFAHSEPAKVNPGDGAIVKEMPTVIDIIMTQDMARQAEANDIDVVDDSGREVTLISAVIDNNDRKHISVTLPHSGLRPGVYTIKWKTLSADDGDTAEGTLSFTWDPNVAQVQPGRVNLKETVPASGGNGPASAPSLGGESGNGTSWVLLAAVAIGMFVAGSGTTFLLVQKRP
ncbi:MAG: copper resistance protein CopC [Dehalococcoidia bacterium]|nr:copper resistance protein CopC [Dehalococcoidia bacterium]